MEDCILINSVDRVDHLRSLVRQDLRDTGVKLPKSKKLKKLNQSRNVSRDDLRTTVFGEHLCDLPAEFVKDHGYVPLFLIEAAKVIDKHLDSEGIFRKSGSVARQKDLRQTVDKGDGLEDANIHDVAVLIKQFFRDLPEPVFTSLYHEAFVKCYQLPAERDPAQALLQLCLCLPLENIGALRFTLHMLGNVASHSDKNKMNASNLALVVAPNFLHSNKGTQKMSSSEEKHLQIEASIVEILIKNCKFVGMVNATLQKQVGLMTECFQTDDELDVSDDNMLEDSKHALQKKKRRRSGSLTGFVSSIASGFAKLRRSTDGKNMNVSSNTTFPGELSLASNSSMAPEQLLDSSAATPCVMRKRRASGETVPFSASKKKAILGNLPQRSALASTPFTPASTSKRNGDGLYANDNAQLNSTTPCQGTKASRKKLNLFTSPANSNKKVKRQSSLAKLASPSAPSGKGKGKNFFRRLSGSRTDKDDDNSLFSSKRGRNRLSSADNASPRSTTSDSAIGDFSSGVITRSASSPSMNEMDVFAESYDGSILSNTSRLDNAERLRRRPRKSIDKSEISSPRPVIVPVIGNAKQVGRSSMRRSRKEDFELETRAKKKEVSFQAPAQEPTLDRSICSQLDESLMMAVLPPPSGFGDQTLIEESINIADNSGTDPSSVMSSVSSETKGHELEPSQRPSKLSFPSSSSSLLETTGNGQCSTIEISTTRQPGNFSSLSWVDGGVRKPTDETFIDVGGVEDLNVSLRGRPSKAAVQEGDYVVLRKNYSVSEGDSQRSNQGGIEMLQENYRSEEDSSSSFNESNSGSMDSDLDELRNIPSKPNIHRKKSLSAQDLQSTSKVSLPIRSQSQYISPYKKNNYKPHLEVSQETHRILTNAGYLKTSDSASRSKDIQVPVKSPKRSAYREEMIQSLRYSFHERHNHTSRSAFGKSNLSNISMDSFNSSVNSDDQSSLQVSEECDQSTSKVVQPQDSDRLCETGKVQEDRDIVGNAGSDTCPEEKNGTDNLRVEEKSDTEDPEADSENSSNLNKASGDYCKPLEKEAFKKTLGARTPSIKDSASKLTLSGFLDEEIKRDVPAIKIKRAELKLPTHESVTDLKIFQAGLVAENVKQFSQTRAKTLTQAKSLTFPDSRKRGNSPIRIPTIFAKNKDSLKHYQEMANFVRERTGTSLSSETTCNTPSPESTSHGDSLSESRTLELGDNESLEPVELADNSASEQDSISAETVPSSPASSHLDKSTADRELIKSPLQESTNTAPTSAVDPSSTSDNPTLKLFTPVGLTPKRLIDTGLNHRSNPRPQLKRLKGQRSPRRMRAHKSPNRRPHAEANASLSEMKLASVDIPLDDDDSSVLNVSSEKRQ